MIHTMATSFPKSAPRLRVGRFPTPVERLPRLEHEIGPDCPEIYIKRDDLSGFAFGGNKVRNLEYVFGRLISEGVEAVVASGGDRSNLARVTAFFCARFGIECHLVLDRKPRPGGARNAKAASTAFEKDLGASVTIVDNIEKRAELVNQTVFQLQQNKRRVAEIPVGGALPEATLGFVHAIVEVKSQFPDVNRIVVASSTGATQAGMIVGSEIFCLDASIEGFSPEPDSASTVSAAVDSLSAASRAIVGSADSSVEIFVSDRYAGAGYCERTPDADEALRLVARTEGILLDEVYTAKAMAALIDRVRTGVYSKDEKLLFWHTGGNLANFYVE